MSAWHFWYCEALDLFEVEILYEETQLEAAYL